MLFLVAILLQCPPPPLIDTQAQKCLYVLHTEVTCLRGPPRFNKSRYSTCMYGRTHRNNNHTHSHTQGRSRHTHHLWHWFSLDSQWLACWQFPQHRRFLMCLLSENYTSPGFIQWQVMIWYPLPLARPHPLGASSTWSRQRHCGVIRLCDASITRYSPRISKGLATGCSAACLQKLTRFTENINAVSLKSSGSEVCLSGKVCWFSVLFVCRLVRCTHRDMPLFRFLSEHSQMHWALDGSTHLAAQFLHVPVPFRPDSKALNISGVLRRVCNMVIPVSALAFPVSAPTVKLWFDRAGAKC